MLKRLFFLIFTGMVFFGCGDGEDRVMSQDDRIGTTSVYVPLAVGETRSFALNLSVDESYRVTAASSAQFASEYKTSYEITYLNRTYPEVVLLGVSEGEEEIIVTAEDASGNSRQAIITAAVDGTAIPDDIDISDGSAGDDENSTSGGGDDGGTTNPPVVDPTYDPNACLENSTLWGYVDDSWGTPEGQFSTNLHYWLRSAIPTEPSTVRFYYRKFSVTADGKYLSLGSYSYDVGDYKVIFSLQMLKSLIGLSSNTTFYVKVRGNCFRGSLPSTIFMPPSKTLTPVFSTSV